MPNVGLWPCSSNLVELPDVFVLQVKINGERVGEFESTAGAITTSYDIEYYDVRTVILESIGLDTNEWISLLEVSRGVDMSYYLHKRMYTVVAIALLGPCAAGANFAPPVLLITYAMYSHSGLSRSVPQQCRIRHTPHVNCDSLRVMVNVATVGGPCQVNLMVAPDGSDDDDYLGEL